MTNSDNTSYFDRLRSYTVLFNNDVTIISNQIFDNLPQFRYWSGSGKPEHHHYGYNGLARHTLEVYELMANSSKTLNLDVRLDLIYLAALFHDVGKLWDYERSVEHVMQNHRAIAMGDWIKSKHARNIHHISRSALVWSKAVDSTGLFREEHDEVLHAILAHHGQREWGSPVAPNSKLAWLLHLCDGISARMDDCDKIDLAGVK